VSWFYVDDGFYDHPKLGRLPPKVRLQCVGLWTVAGAWCRKKLQGGKVPRYQVEHLGGTKAAADALVECGLWERDGEDYQFHQWGEWQETPEELAAKREKGKTRQANWRDKRRDRRLGDARVTPLRNAEMGGGNALVTGLSPGDPSPSPSPRDLRTPLPPSGASASAGQEVRDGWAAAWFAAGAGTMPVLSGQTFAAAVEFARQVAKTHNKPLGEAAKAIAGHVIKHAKQARDIPFDLARVDPFAAPRIETAEEHNRRANHVGESYEDYLKRKAADPWAKAMSP